ncbi:hypothetical protein JYB62_04840 [Algoriphagus lutimaris]|uniref:hypothetical protein n=1 Tax=Algoriphagus lutimaris TaxID=613197 RepID=UPI00196AFA39|nr:hypothetical protein [Algoriphagus lutimaris]MBN3519320.1 hypothetical protein [Algoriphagus lutimaris]
MKKFNTSLFQIKNGIRSNILWDYTDLYFSPIIGERWDYYDVYDFNNSFSFYFKFDFEDDFILEKFEEVYREKFKLEIFHFPEPWLTIPYLRFYHPFINITSISFQYIHPIHDIYVINRHGENLRISDYLILLFQEDIKLYFEIEENEKISDEIAIEYLEEVYPDLFFELSNRHMLNEHGYYAEIYNEIINQIFN